MIDPVKAVIAYLAEDAALLAACAGRLANKHAYGGSWRKADPSVILRPDGGQPDVDLPVQRVRLEVCCYGADPLEAMTLWKELVRISRVSIRKSVATEDGAALIHSFLQASSPSLLVDPDNGMDVCMAFFEAVVAEDAKS